MKKEGDVGFLIRMIDIKMRNNLDNQLRKHGLTSSQSEVLFRLKKNNGTLSQKALQEQMNVSHPTMVGLIKRLEGNGFVICRADAGDKRSKIVTVSDKAIEFYADMEMARNTNEQLMLKNIDDKEKEVLTDLLHRVAENVSVWD